MDSMPSSNIRSRTSFTTCPSALSRSRLSKRSTETYLRPIYEPLMVAAKPIHPLLLTGNTHPSKTKQIKPPLSAPPRVRSTLTPSFTDKRGQLLISDLSNNDGPSESSTPSPQLQNVKEEDEQQAINTPRPRTTSNISLKSTIKLKSQTPRSRSAVDIKCSYTFNKNYPRFILITDQEHRIESWYHQYPFIVSDDLIQSFQPKSNQSTISAYFINDHQQQQSLNSNKRYLQGQPFHINNDWKKYDIILISNNIYQQIIIHLQTIIKLSGKIIPIYQINHHEDLKTQVRYICKQLNQQVLSHV
jgi:hypothetical protein